MHWPSNVELRLHCLSLNKIGWIIDLTENYGVYVRPRVRRWAPQGNIGLGHLSRPTFDVLCLSLGPGGTTLRQQRWPGRTCYARATRLRSEIAPELAGHGLPRGRLTTLCVTSTADPFKIITSVQRRQRWRLRGEIRMGGEGTYDPGSAPAFARGDLPIFP